MLQNCAGSTFHITKESLPLKGNLGELTQSFDFDWYSFHVNLPCSNMNYEVFAQYDSKSRNINEKFICPLRRVQNLQLITFYQL